MLWKGEKIGINYVSVSFWYSSTDHECTQITVSLHCTVHSSFIQNKTYVCTNLEIESAQPVNIQLLIYYAKEKCISIFNWHLMLSILVRVQSFFDYINETINCKDDIYILYHQPADSSHPRPSALLSKNITNSLLKRWRNGIMGGELNRKMGKFSLPGWMGLK